MKRKTIAILIGVFLIGIVTAQVAVLSAVFTPEPPPKVEFQSGNITFDCGKVSMQVHLDEPDLNIGDDFEYAAKQICQDEIKNVMDWEGREYKEDENGKRKFEVVP